MGPWFCDSVVNPVGGATGVLYARRSADGISQGLRFRQT
jgi:hypothetical protein